MSGIKFLSRLAGQFMALSMRERLLAVAAAVGVIYFVFDLAFLRPNQAQAKALRTQIAQQEVEIAAFDKALQTMSTQRRVDPLARQRAERDELRNTLAQGDALLGQTSADVKMGEVIRSLVAATPGLSLVSLKTLPVEIFFKGTAAMPSPAASGSKRATVAAPSLTLYKHGVEVTVQGKYVTLVPYLQGLERNAKGVFWGNVKVDVVAYPDATLKLTIYTLSSRPELPLG